MTNERKELNHYQIEKRYVKKILGNCTSQDLEANGSKLDKILDEFLRELRFPRLADTAKSVECWRA